MISGLRKTFMELWKWVEAGSILLHLRTAGLLPFWFLATVRVLLTIVPQNGYIHPDEYFQSVEVVAGDVFDIEVSRPWEFNTTFPLRSIALLYGVVGAPLMLLQMVSPFASLWFGLNLKTPYLTLVAPRMVVCVLSFLTDYSLYRICQLYGQNYKTRLVMMASSFVMLVYGTRTFSNSLEMFLQSLLLYYVAECMAQSDQVIQEEEYLNKKYKMAETPVERVKVHKLRSVLPSHSLNHCFVIATITVVGIFNRPTFLAFAFAPVFFWLQRGLGSTTVSLYDFHVRMLSLVLAGVPTVVLLILIDSVYYGYLTAGEIGVMKLSLDNLVVTPLNFIKYNMNAGNLAQHGLHPRYLHVLVNIPLLYNVLGIVGVAMVIRIIYRGMCRRWCDLPRVQSIIGLMTMSLVVPVMLLSLFPHQEARFLIPVTLPIMFLHTQHLHRGSSPEHRHEHCDGHTAASSASSTNVVLLCWYLVNILLAVFFGFLHQGGIYPLAEHFSQEMTTKPRLTTIHVITSHVYSMPLFPLMLRNSKKSLLSKQTSRRYLLAREFYLYEMGSKNLEQVLSKVELLLKSCELMYVEKKLDYKLYLALPMSLTDQFYELADRMNTTTFSYITLKVFYPHVSIEAFPGFSLVTKRTFNGTLSTFCEEEYFHASPIKFLSNYAYQFGLALIKIQKFAWLM